MRAVTLEGDLFDPSGTLTGGSKNNKSNILLMLHQLDLLESKVAKLDARKQACRGNNGTHPQVLKDHEASLKSAQDVANKLSRARHDLEMAETRVKESKSFRLNARKEEIEAEIAANRTLIENSKTAIRDLEAKIKQLELESKDVNARKVRGVWGCLGDDAGEIASRSQSGCQGCQEASAGLRGQESQGDEKGARVRIVGVDA
jgi:structural maintenance of chromosome 2